MPLEEGDWVEPDHPNQHDPSEEATATPPRDPAPVTTPEAQVLESHRGPGEEASDQTTEQKEPLPEFDPKVREDFDGLLYLGRLTHDFNWVGHSFTIRTLTTGEILEVGLLHKPYAGSISDVKAYQAALIAACVLTVDGNPLPLPISNDPMDTHMRNKFQYVYKHWFPPLLDKIYEEYLLLEARVDQVIAAMGNQSR